MNVRSGRQEDSRIGREFAYSDKDFQRVRSMIYRLAGINLNSSKADMAYSRLSRRVRVLGLQGVGDYLDLVERDPGEIESFINALTTNLTYFFRESHHFTALSDFLRKRCNRSVIRVWCSASSTGEEPYSILMTALETLGESAASRFRLIASDLDTSVLSKAQAGIYSMDTVSKLSDEKVRRFFLRGAGKNEGLARIRPELAQMVKFERINLLDNSWPLKGEFDAIFCRNVMIYFDKPTQRSILEKFRPLLANDGLLFAGHSENFSNALDLFRPIGRTIYRPVS